MTKPRENYIFGPIMPEVVGVSGQPTQPDSSIRLVIPSSGLEIGVHTNGWELEIGARHVGDVLDRLTPRVKMEPFATSRFDVYHALVCFLSYTGHNPVHLRFSPEELKGVGFQFDDFRSHLTNLVIHFADQESLNNTFLAVLSETPFVRSGYESDEHYIKRFGSQRLLSILDAIEPRNITGLIKRLYMEPLLDASDPTGGITLWSSIALQELRGSGAVA